MYSARDNCRATAHSLDVASKRTDSLIEINGMDTQVSTETGSLHLRLAPYHDPVGYPTIGYGHLLSRERHADLGRWVLLGNEAEARDVLALDMEKAVAAVWRLIVVDLSDEQEAALIDFAFNCGAGNLQASTLRRVINREEHADAPAQFRRWVWAAGRKLPGLIRRRGEEAELYAYGS